MNFNLDVTEMLCKLRGRFLEPRRGTKNLNSDAARRRDRLPRCKFIA
jgi:hypothetical protein